MSHFPLPPPPHEEKREACINGEDDRWAHSWAQDLAQTVESSSCKGALSFCCPREAATITPKQFGKCSCVFSWGLKELAVEAHSWLELWNCSHGAISSCHPHHHPQACGRELSRGSQTGATSPSVWGSQMGVLWAPLCPSAGYLWSRAPLSPKASVPRKRNELCQKWHGRHSPAPLGCAVPLPLLAASAALQFLTRVLWALALQWAAGRGLKASQGSAEHLWPCSSDADKLRNSSKDVSWTGLGGNWCSELKVWGKHTLRAEVPLPRAGFQWSQGWDCSIRACWHLHLQGWGSLFLVFP